MDSIKWKLDEDDSLDLEVGEAAIVFSDNTCRLILATAKGAQFSTQAQTQAMTIAHMLHVGNEELATLMQKVNKELAESMKECCDECDHRDCSDLCASLKQRRH